MNESEQDAPISTQAISMERARITQVLLGDTPFDVWMVADMDSLINDFVAEQEKNTALKNRCPFGAALWPSGRAFATWALQQHAAGNFPNINDELKSLGALELGCGVGLVSCVLAHCGVTPIVATDYEPAYADFVKANSNLFNVTPETISFATLDWVKPLPEKMCQAFPLVVACDVLYENSHIDFLPEYAASLLHNDGVFYLADPERFRFESAVKKLGKCFESIICHVVQVPNSVAEAQQGLVNLGHKVTQVQILECRKPRRSPG